MAIGILPETFETILAEVSAGAPIRKVLDKHGVVRDAFYGLLAQAPEAQERYARAKFNALESMADDAAEIADDESISVDSRRIRVDTRKWFLSKLAPKRYGDLLHLQHSGSIDLATELEAARKRAKTDDKSE